MRFVLAILAALLGPLAPCATGDTLMIEKARSSVDVAVESTIDSFVGHFADFDADVAIQGGVVNKVSGHFHFLFANLKTGDGYRDAQMCKWLQNDRFPGADLTIVGVAPDGNAGFVATGRLKFHGTERDVSFPVKITLEKKILTVDGDATLDTRDYDLPIYRQFVIFAVDPVVHVRFRVIGRLAEQ